LPVRLDGRPLRERPAKFRMDLRLATALSIGAGSLRSVLGAAVREATATSDASALTVEAIASRAAALAPVNAGELAARLRGALPAADAALADGRIAGLTTVVWGDERYPTRLSTIYDPPPILWCRGDPSVLSRFAVALVGARAASPYARDVADRLGEDLARRGVTVVSGLARGVDGASHRGALAGGGTTVAVLGSGADVIYPPEHDELAAQIARQGAVISELPPGSPPCPVHFPLRNRIISGLSAAVVIVEAGEKSGSLHTARAALEQGREVMAVPGSVLGQRNRGSHALLRDGAKLVEGVDDILEELGASAPGVPATDASKSMQEEPLLSVMDDGEGYGLDELEALTGLSGTVLLPRLLELELDGRIARREAGRFVRVQKRVLT
jgi:DNA processing protein